MQSAARECFPIDLPLPRSLALALSPASVFARFSVGLSLAESVADCFPMRTMFICDFSSFRQLASSPHTISYISYFMIWLDRSALGVNRTVPMFLLLLSFPIAIAIFRRNYYLNKNLCEQRNRARALLLAAALLRAEAADDDDVLSL